MTSNFKTAFPHMADDIPAIPDSWKDSSWHNDACPSFYVMEGGAGDSNYKSARVWICESDAAEREFPEMPRFQLSYENGESDFFVGLATDNFAQLVEYVAIRQFLGAAYAAQVGYNPFLDCPDIDPAQVLENLAWLKAQA